MSRQRPGLNPPWATYREGQLKVPEKLEILWLMNNCFRFATVQYEQFLKSEMW